MNFTSLNIHDIYNFIYIALMILGGVTLTLTIILNAKERGRQHKAILLFVTSIFLYMVTDFITYYFLGKLASGSFVFILITLSDTLFCLVITAWVYAIMVLAKIEEAINMKWMIIASAIYLVSSQILSFYLGRYDSYTLHVDKGFWNIIFQILNGGYDIGIMAIGIRCMILLCKKYKKGASRNINLLMSALLIGYMVWISYWDYSTWYKTEEKLLNIYAMDPLILLYAILNVFLIYYFYKNDPLKISESQISPDEAVNIIAKRYMLSEREREVLILVNRGLSNKQIATELSISENTVKRHISNIFKKTETQSRHEIIYKISKAN